MELKKSIQIDRSQDQVFELFVGNMMDWWPKEYSWSQHHLQQMFIDPVTNGFCTEIGPHGFRCDWGRVLEVNTPSSIHFTWQISPQREPVPDADQASVVHIRFSSVDEHCLMDLEHANFENHGKGYENYHKMMDSPEGWQYILDCFKNYCENG
ncbi:SRPBCC domain-containing protein [Nonlabens xiamenensis]|uniref:SRPBCC domain-containing protein n=1 Tax=Nonlabens xiamenensis TaxID=2341043 RepID=UPI000F60D29E|nr:SRPBCC domain-containing protein [Nonlabens xiamenensis]